MGRGRAAVFTVTVPLTWQDDTVQVLLTLQFKQVLQKHLCRISVFLHIPYALSFTYLQLPQWTVFQDGLANKVNYKHNYYLTLKNYIFWW